MNNRDLAAELTKIARYLDWWRADDYYREPEDTIEFDEPVYDDEHEDYHERQERRDRQNRRGSHWTGGKWQIFEFDHGLDGMRTMLEKGESGHEDHFYETSEIEILLKDLGIGSDRTLRAAGFHVGSLKLPGDEVRYPYLVHRDVYFYLLLGESARLSGSPLSVVHLNKLIDLDLVKEGLK